MVSIDYKKLFQNFNLLIKNKKKLKSTLKKLKVKSIENNGDENQETSA